MALPLIRVSVRDRGRSWSKGEKRHGNAAGGRVFHSRIQERLAFLQNEKRLVKLRQNLGDPEKLRKVFDVEKAKASLQPLVVLATLIKSVKELKEASDGSMAQHGEAQDGKET